MNTRNFFNAVFDILVMDGGANERDRDEFVSYCLESGSEYRFMGKFGFGGKYRGATNQIDYYSETATPELDALQAEINLKLSQLTFK